MHEHRFLNAHHNLPGPSESEGPRQFPSNTDADGIADNVELMAGADPLDADEDGDGVPDGVSAADWMAHPYQGAATGTTNTVLRILQAAAPGTSASVSIGGLTIPLTIVRDIPLSLPVDVPLSVGVASFGDSGANTNDIAGLITMAGYDLVYSCNDAYSNVVPHVLSSASNVTSTAFHGGLSFLTFSLTESLDFLTTYHPTQEEQLDDLRKAALPGKFFIYEEPLRLLDEDGYFANDPPMPEGNSGDE